MDFFIQRFCRLNINVIFYVALGMFGFISFPAYSSLLTTTPISTYGIINLAFILGLSLPVIGISLLCKFKDKFRLRYFLLLTLSLIGIIYSVAFIQLTYKTLPLVFSILCLISLYFSLVPNSRNIMPKITKITHVAVITVTLIYIALIVFYPNENNFAMWGVLSGIILTLMLIRIKCITSNFMALFINIGGLCLPILYFSVSVLLWLNKNIGLQWFMLNIAVFYILFLCVVCWKITRNNDSDNTGEQGGFHSNNMDSSKSLSDSATNLPSQQQAFQTINKALKSHPNNKYATIVFKPINFQQVNKILGHKNSDILLLQLAYCLQKSVKNNNNLINFNHHKTPVRIARLRGLHFLAVLQLKEDEINADLFVEALCKELSLAVPDAMSFKSFSLNFELTFGVSFINQYTNSLSQTIAHAEDALLRAESDQILLSYFDKDEIIYTESHLLQMEHLKQDIIDDNLYWYVQPQTRLRDRKLVGFELSVQWNNDENIPLEFQSFIETAEHSGEIYLLTKQMITRAFKLILKLQRVSNYETVSIKLLSQYLLEPDLVSFIERQIITYNVPAKYLVIELPEKVVLSASERAKTIIDELKSLNVNIAISDFSGSYESLRYIRKMAVHQIKIDCGHISKAGDEPDNAIITSLIELTKKMELSLIGTSINNKEVEQSFMYFGGELAQGGVIDKGVAADSIDTWVTTWNNLYNPV